LKTDEILRRKKMATIEIKSPLSRKEDQGKRGENICVSQIMEGVGGRDRGRRGVKFGYRLPSSMGKRRVRGGGIAYDVGTWRRKKVWESRYAWGEIRGLGKGAELKRAERQELQRPERK